MRIGDEDVTIEADDVTVWIERDDEPGIVYKATVQDMFDRQKETIRELMKRIEKIEQFLGVLERERMI